MDIQFGNCCFHAALGLASLGLSAPLLGGAGISGVDLAVLLFGSRQTLCVDAYGKVILVSCCDWRLSSLETVGFGKSVQ